MLGRATIRQQYFHGMEAIADALDLLDVADRDSDQALIQLVHDAEKNGNQRLPLLLYLTALDHPVKLGVLYRNFDLASDESRTLLTQYVCPQTDDAYPMLDLSRQELTSIPAEVVDVEIPAVDIGGDDGPLLYSEICLGYNKIAPLSQSDFDLLSHFRGVHLMAIGLRSLPSDVGRLSTCIMLNLSLNSISELPNELYSLSELRALKVNWTDIECFPKKILGLPELVLVEASMTGFIKTVHWLEENPDMPKSGIQEDVDSLVREMGELGIEVEE